MYNFLHMHWYQHRRVKPKLVDILHIHLACVFGSVQLKETSRGRDVRLLKRSPCLITCRQGTSSGPEHGSCRLQSSNRMTVISPVPSGGKLGSRSEESGRDCHPGGCACLWQIRFFPLTGIRGVIWVGRPREGEHLCGEQFYSSLESTPLFSC